MDYSLAKELKDAGFPQNGKSCDTHSDVNDSTLIERVVHPTLSELIEACPKQMGTATFVLGSANRGQAWVACYFDFRANRGAELNETGKTPDEAVARLWAGAPSCWAATIVANRPISKVAFLIECSSLSRSQFPIACRVITRTIIFVV